MLNNVATLAGNVLDGAQAAPANPLQVSAVVRKLFMVLHGSYGNLFLSKFSTGEKDAEGRDKGIRAAMKVWDSKLANFAPDVVEAAAGRMTSKHPEFPPNLPQFEALCEAIQPRKTYAQEVGLPMLPEPKADPERVAAELAKLGHIKTAEKTSPHGMKDWAYRLKERDARGEKINSYQRMSYQIALKETA